VKTRNVTSSKYYSEIYSCSRLSGVWTKSTRMAGALRKHRTCRTAHKGSKVSRGEDGTGRTTMDTTVRTVVASLPLCRSSAMQVGLHGISADAAGRICWKLDTGDGCSLLRTSCLCAPGAKVGYRLFCVISFGLQLRASGNLESIQVGRHLNQFSARFVVDIIVVTTYIYLRQTQE